MKQRLLITGGSGFLGWTLCRVALENWDVVGTVHSHPLEIPGARAARVDLTRFGEVKELFGDVRPDAVIHTAAASGLNFCQDEPILSRRINVEASASIAGLCADYDIPCVFTSTDIVFDGRQAPYCETDAVNPLNRYGEQKALAEAAMRERFPGVAICRMPLMYGSGSPVAGSFLTSMLKAMREGAVVNMFTDEIRTPVSGEDAAKGLLLALEKRERLLHLGGPRRLSRLEFGELMVEAFGVRRACLNPCLQSDVPMAAERPQDVSLDSSRAFALGYAPATPEEALARLAEEAQL